MVPWSPPPGQGTELYFCRTCEVVKRLSRDEVHSLHESAVAQSMQQHHQQQQQQLLRSHRAADAMPLLGTSGHLPHHLPTHASAAPGSAATAALTGPDGPQPGTAQADSESHTQFGGNMRSASGGVRSAWRIC